jgi:Na+-translocating ferredoxin:NAD+ oxidoreductase subunit E
MLKQLWKDFVAGIISENAVLRLMIGLCPTLAVSNNATNAFGMGVAATFVLVFSNVVIAAMRKWIPSSIRIPIFITVISTFVTIIDYLMQAYSPALHKALGVFVPLIVVNCIILGRAEAFAYKFPVLNSLMDGLGMGIGFTLVITIIGTIREILGAGSIFGHQLFSPGIAALIMILPPGAFLVIGLLMVGLNWLEKKQV